MAIVCFDWLALDAEKIALLNGFSTTLWVTLFCTVCSIAFAFALFFFETRIKQHWTLDLINAWLEVVRNVPLLIQLYFFYKALPAIGVVLPPITCGLIGLSLYSTAYLIEVFRSGLATLPQQQLESARSLGLPHWHCFWRIMMPQLGSVILPPMASIVVNIVKNSSLLAFITVADLFYVIYKGGVTFFHYIEFFSVGLLGYLVFNYFVTLTFQMLENLTLPAHLKFEKRHTAKSWAFAMVKNNLPHDSFRK